jgi:hypothetical protein
MIARSLFLGFAAAVSLVLTARATPSSAAPRPVLKPANGIELVQNAFYYKRRWRYRNGTHVRAPLADVDDDGSDTWVRAPFARVYTGRSGTWVRAPFVNLWGPR